MELHKTTATRRLSAALQLLKRFVRFLNPAPGYDHLSRALEASDAVLKARFYDEIGLQGIYDPN
jgi:hypothetical protein